MEGLRKPIELDGEWKMGIELTIPMAIQYGDFLFTRGQIDVDEKTRVLNRGNAIAQVKTCVRHIARTLASAGAKADGIVQLTHYYRAGSVEDPRVLKDIILSKLKAPEDTPVALVPVPHFYFDGTEGEPDAIVMMPDRHPTYTRILAVDWVTLAKEGDLGFLGGTKFITSENLERTRLELSQLVSAFKHSTGRARIYIQARDICTYNNIRDGLKLAADGWAINFLPCITPEVEDISISVVGSVMLNGSGQWTFDEQGAAWLLTGNGLGFIDLIDATEIAVPKGLATTEVLARQARRMMDSVGENLATQGIGFGHVLKATTYYRGGRNSDDLYANLSVRDSYYSYPGPASTGVPFLELDRPNAELVSSLIVAFPNA
ncbi:Rid family hydrolase [Ruegeria sp. SCP11]|uniref:Rid family hydrolase n=1 Tax=Ruegeria sp. SCP11 TaxID=3141378 RepID=UPI00333C370A